MSSSPLEATALARDVRTTDETLIVDLHDGRTIIVPLDWFPRLHRATSDQRRMWRLIGNGAGIHWPEIDEDLSVAGLLRGTAAPRPGKSAA